MGTVVQRVEYGEGPKAGSCFFSLPVSSSLENRVANPPIVSAQSVRHVTRENMWKFLRRGKEDRVHSSDVQLFGLPEAGVESEREAISQIAADGSSKFGHGVVDESGKLLGIVCCQE